MSLRALAAVLLALAVTACHRAPKKPDRTAPWPASASPSASTAPLLRRLHYRLARGSVSFELPARHADPRGTLPDPQGDLDVDLDDLSRTRGNVSFDLRKLVVNAATGEPDTSNTARALAWLELGQSVTSERRELAERADFAITALDAGHPVAAPSSERRAPRRELESHWKVEGDLSLHAVRAPLTTEVNLSLVPGPDPAAPPVELLIRSRKPLVVSLSTHDIRPRDERGVPIAKDLVLFGDKVGTDARVSFELVFVPR